MTDPTRSNAGGGEGRLLDTRLSRRQVLRGGLLASGAAFLAACGAAATPAPTAAPATPAPATPAPATPAPATPAPATPAPATPAPSAAATPAPAPSESFAGLQLHNFTGGYMIPWLDAGTAKWKAETGGDALEDNVTFAEKQIKQAGVIATQDSTYDMMYTTVGYGYMLKFGARLLLPIEQNFGDLTDFFPSALKDLTTPDGVLRGLPLYDSPYVWVWNKKLFEAIGEDPEKPPDTYAGLFALAPKFVAKSIIPSIQPWLATQAITFAQLYWTQIYNSTGHPMFSDDRTQLMFDGDEGLQTFNTIADGFKSGWWDSKYMNIVNEHDAWKIFGDGNVAAVMWSESPNLPAATAAIAGIKPFPGITSGTTGSSGGADGLGVSKFSKNIPACWSWSKRTFSQEIGKAAATTVKDSTGALVLYPVARNSVISDPDVIKAQPLQPIYAEQNKGQTSGWATPYDPSPVFNDVIAKMISGDYTGAQGHFNAVKGVQDIIIKYLST